MRSYRLCLDNAKKQCGNPRCFFALVHEGIQHFLSGPAFTKAAWGRRGGEVMNETTQYHLNQWEAEDRILRQDFNRDNANLEQALLTLKTAVEAEVRARTEAVAGERSDAASALETVRAALDAAKAEKTALAALQAQVDALPFVRLREVTTTAAANQIDVDISNLALAQYLYVLIVPRLSCGTTHVLMRLNGVSDFYYDAENNSKNYLTWFHPVSDDCETALRLMGAAGSVRCLREFCDENGTTSYSGGKIRAVSGVTPETLTTLNFVAEDGVLIEAGGKIFIYGVKA